MKPWVKVLIYILFVIFVTYLVATYSEAAKIVDFLRDQQSVVEDDPLDFLAATVVANNHDGTDVYIQNVPLYEETFDSSVTSQHIKVSIYTLVEFKGTDAHNSLVILIRDLSINDDDAYLDDNDYHEVLANIVLDREITINDYTASTFNETFVTAYDDETKLLLINTDLLDTSTGPAEIEQITISYTLESGDEVSLVTLYNADLISMTANDIFDSSYNRNISAVTSDQIDIFNLYGLDNYESNNDVYYNSHWLETLSTYDNYYFKFAMYELIILLPITYFIFFHKRVMTIARYNKELKKEQYKARQEALKNKFREEDSKIKENSK